MLLLSSGIKISLLSLLRTHRPSRTCNIRSARHPALFRPLGVEVNKERWEVARAVARLLLRPRAPHREARNRIGVETEGRKSRGDRPYGPAPAAVQSSVGGFAHVSRRVSGVSRCSERRRSVASRKS
jgi:hypothetical protein